MAKPPDDEYETLKARFNKKNRRGIIGTAHNLSLGISDRGDHFRVLWGQQANGDGTKTLSDKQLRRLLIEAVRDHGYNKIYCYHGDKVDYATAGRAEIMLAQLCRPPDRYSPRGGVLYEHARKYQEMQDAEDRRYRQALHAYETAGGPAPGRRENYTLQVVRSRMEPGSLPKCFNAARHERLARREERDIQRSHYRNNKGAEFFARMGL